MMVIRKSNERGAADHGWLKSQHTFSFADYYDPAQMGFGPLRVINEDRIAPGTGFGSHPHRDMEIISYVVSGALEHQDSAGNKNVIRPGEVQRMSAGTGVVHSEYNFYKDRETHFFQVWIQPNKKGVPFSYGQRSFENELNEKNLVLVVSNNGRDGSISIHQDADMYVSRLKSGDSLRFAGRPTRNVWLQVVKGRLNVNQVTISTGDGLATKAETALEIAAEADSELLLFDLP